MINKFYAVAALSFAILAGFNANAGGVSKTIELEIKAENARWAAAFGQGDYDAVGSLYTEGGELLPPEENRVLGPQAITNYFKKGFSASKPDRVSFSNYEFYGNSETVTEISDNEIRDYNGNFKSLGKQTLVFLKVKGAWKLHRDMWSDNSPANQ